MSPSELKLKENISTFKVSFLGLATIGKNEKYKTQLYDKRDALSFSIVWMPHLDGNVPSYTMHL